MSRSSANPVSRALLVSPSSAPNPKVQLRINTSIDDPARYLDPPPRYQSYIETVRTAPLLLQPLPPRRVISQGVDTVTPSRTTVRVEASQVPVSNTATPPPPTAPLTVPSRPKVAEHGRKISDKFKSIFSHVRKTSEPVDVHPIEPLVTGTLSRPDRKISHRRTDSAPEGDERIKRWIQDTAIQGRPLRPHRSPNTASFIVSAESSFEPVFPRYDPTAMTMNTLQSGRKKEDQDMVDENDIVEPITAALYPLGKGLLGTTQRRAHLDDALPGVTPIKLSHFSPITPAVRAQNEHLDVMEDRDHEASSPSLSDEGSFDAMWYMTAHY